MNKKLITLAVAAAMAAPVAAMADATLYGKLHVSIDYQEVKPNGLAGEIIDDKYKGWGLNGAGPQLEGAGRANRIGVKGSEDLGGGLKAIYQVELGVTLADRDGQLNNGDRGSAINMRNSFVGLAGNWGTFLVGRHDTPLKISTGKLDLFSDTMADYNGTVGFQDIRADNAIAYISPSWGGFQLAAAVIPGGGGRVTGTNDLNADSINEAWSLAAIYKNGPWYASAAYESLNSDLGFDVPVVTDSTDAVGSVVDPSAGMDANGQYPVFIVNEDGMPATTSSSISAFRPDDWNKWRIGLGVLDWNGFTVTAVYENQSSNFFVDGQDAELWQIQAGYAFGNNMIKAMYGQLDRDHDRSDLERDDLNSISDLEEAFNDADRSTWAIAFDHNFSKRTRAYVLYTDTDDDAASFNDWNGFSMGMIHKF